MPSSISDNQKQMAAMMPNASISMGGMDRNVSREKLSIKSFMAPPAKQHTPFYIGKVR